MYPIDDTSRRARPRHGTRRSAAAVETAIGWATATTRIARAVTTAHGRAADRGQSIELSGNATQTGGAHRRTSEATVDSAAQRGDPAPLLDTIVAIDVDELTAITAGTQTNE